MQIAALAETMDQLTCRLPKSCREAATPLTVDDEQVAVVQGRTMDRHFTLFSMLLQRDYGLKKRLTG
jgi:penicillin V acylase-like amidase (Ntn superfamily)